MTSVLCVTWFPVIVFLFSVLAAASPVFAAMFCENPLVEEDVRISVVGYSYTSIRSIIEYIYTGSLEFSDCDKVKRFHFTTNENMLI